MHENLEVISIGERLASADGAEQHCAALDVLDAQISELRQGGTYTQANKNACGRRRLGLLHDADVD